MRFRFSPFAILLCFLLTSLSTTFADTTPSFNLAIKNHAFIPDTLTIPANKQVRIVINNQDALPAEFESYDFNREKVVPGGSTVTIYVGPMKAGSYQFFNDFYSSSTGKLIVKPEEH
jgi:hypothetical protein